jgi:hypothetical protein
MWAACSVEEIGGPSRVVEKERKPAGPIRGEMKKWPMAGLGNRNPFLFFLVYFQNQIEFKFE